MSRLIAVLKEYVFVAMVGVVGILVAILWDSLTESAKNYFFNNTYEIESIDRLARSLTKRSRFLGPNPILENRSGNRRTIWAEEENICSGKGARLTTAQRDNLGSFFTIRYRKSESTSGVAFRFKGGKIIYAGFTKPFLRLCFTDDREIVNIGYANNTLEDVSADRSIIIMVDGINAEIDSSNFSSRTSKVISWSIIALLVFFVFITFNAVSLIQNTKNDLGYRKKSTEEMEKMNIEIMGMNASVRELLGYSRRIEPAANVGTESELPEKIEEKRAKIKSQTEDILTADESNLKDLVDKFKSDIR